jgi:hypothetical protein
VTVRIPEYVDWEVARLVAERIVSQHELLTTWSLEDVWDHHVILDAKETALIKANER